ncbi:hypothetical protein BT63DRAFT_457058 [Microthyrium microscopicum]|uniref:Uncharacterized protein n=1 Tax=Microthyrium microscopicum TaxID=703497 RepID=A0A6A6U7Y4_9PEZI|nr:hypothetical protein BT63DRAFT_457058 [Microthyrium microscopicum]
MRLSDRYSFLLLIGSVIAVTDHPFAKREDATIVSTAELTCADPVALHPTNSRVKRQASVITSGVQSIARGITYATMAFLGSIPDPTTLSQNWNVAMADLNRGLSIFAESTCISTQEAFTVQGTIGDTIKPQMESLLSTLNEAKDSLVKGGQEKFVVRILEKILGYIQDMSGLIGGKMPPELVAVSRDAIQPIISSLQDRIEDWRILSQPQDGSSIIISSIRSITKEIASLDGEVKGFTEGPGPQLLAERDLVMQNNFGYAIRQIETAASVPSSSVKQVEAEASNVLQSVEKLVISLNSKRYLLLKTNQARVIEKLVTATNKAIKNMALAIEAKLPTDARKLHQELYSPVFAQLGEFLYTWSGKVYDDDAPVCVGPSSYPKGCR